MNRNIFFQNFSKRYLLLCNKPAAVVASQVLLHYQTVSEPATIRKLLSVLHKSSGEVLKKKPKLVSVFSQCGSKADVAVYGCCAVSFRPLRCLSKGMNAVVEIQTQRPISLELYKDYKELGRFMLRYVGSTIAAGVVTEVTAAQHAQSL